MCTLVCVIGYTWPLVGGLAHSIPSLSRSLAPSPPTSMHTYAWATALDGKWQAQTPTLSHKPATKERSDDGDVEEVTAGSNVRHLEVEGEEHPRHLCVSLCKLSMRITV